LARFHLSGLRVNQDFDLADDQFTSLERANDLKAMFTGVIYNQTRVS